MIEEIKPWAQGKRALLLGLGREGQSTYHVLRQVRSYEKLDIADVSSPASRPGEDGLWTIGSDYQECPGNYDAVFKSLGIALEKLAEEYKCRILSQTEVFLQFFRDQIIGTTGTKGKSAVTTLLYHILKNAGMDTMILGNIGIPALDHMEEVTKDTRIVLELSCHQLEYMTVSPHIGVPINIHEEHLNHYSIMEKYVESEHHIFKNQTGLDMLICNIQCLPQEGICSSRLIRAGVDAPDAQLCVSEEKGEAWVRHDARSYRIPVDQVKLLGQHNYSDIGVVYAVRWILGMDEELSTQGLKTYEPLPHRFQYLEEWDGVKYYDDSISTICDTTIQASKTLKDTDMVLIGGMDRGIDYRELIEYLSQCQVRHIIPMEATGKRIYQEIYRYYPDSENRSRLILAEHLEDGVGRVKEITRPGCSCVLSPATASYGMFKNFEEKGEIFVHLVFRS